ncbi:MAG: SPFH domain-containing protein [Carbonactinosporaceae bacterium]
MSRDNVQMTYTGVVTFSLDPGCPTLRRFHEQIGLKDWNGQQAYINHGFEGWSAMLDVYIGQPLQRAVNTVAGRYGYRDLYNDNAARSEAEKVVERELPAYVEALAGGPFFEHFSVHLQKPSAPMKIRNALEAEQEAVAEQGTSAAQRDSPHEVPDVRRLQEAPQRGVLPPHPPRRAGQSGRLPRRGERHAALIRTAWVRCQRSVLARCAASTMRVRAGSTAS